MSLRRSPIRRVVTVCAAVFAAVVVLAGPASAHAELVASTPSQGAVVAGEPTRVALRFSEEIVPRLSAIKVIGPDGRRLDSGAPHAGPSGAESMTVDLAPDARHGTFVVVWQVTAADDGHASSGTVMFAVGAPSVPASVTGLGHNRLTSAVYDAGQWIGFAGLAMVAGVAALRTRRREEPIGPTQPEANTLTRTGPDTDTSTSTSTKITTAGSAPLDAALADTSKAVASIATASAPTTPALADTSRAVASIATAPTPTTPALADTSRAITTTAAASTTTTTPPTAALTEASSAAPAATPPATSPTESPSAPRPAAIPGPLPQATTPTWPAALGWSFLLIGTLIQVTAYAPAARGLPLTRLLDRSLLSVTLATREGHAFMARLVLLAVAAVVGDAVLRRATSSRLPSAFILAIAATWGATGHAATGGGAAVAMVALTLHVAAMAVWAGGLFVVAALLAARNTAAAPVVRRFSRLALAAVILSAATGLYQAWREVGSVSALFDTTYGRLLLTKVAILLCVLAVARQSRGIVAKWRGDHHAATLRRNVMLELAGTSVLLLVAVLLAGNAPAR